MDRASVVISIIILVSLGVVLTQTGSRGLAPARFLNQLAMWGYGGEVLLTGVGLIALAYFGGRGERLVAVGCVALIFLASVTMRATESQTSYPLESGFDRATLLELAEEDPQLQIAGEIPTVLRIGEALGTASLVMPAGELADRIRAFTEVDVVAESDLREVPDSDFTQFGDLRRVIGLLGTVTVSVIGESQEYVWTSGPDGVLIIAGDLLTDLNP